MKKSTYVIIASVMLANSYAYSAHALRATAPSPGETFDQCEKKCDVALNAALDVCMNALDKALLWCVISDPLNLNSECEDAAVMAHTACANNAFDAAEACYKRCATLYPQQGTVTLK